MERCRHVPAQTCRNITKQRGRQQQAPDVGADDERFERPRPDNSPRVGDDRADEPLEGAPDLGHGDRDLALGGLDPTGPVAVAQTHPLGCPLVAGTPEEGRHLVLDGALEDELGTQAPELAQLIGTADPIEQDRLDRFLDPGARGYSLLHGVVSFCELPGPLWSLRHLDFYRGVRTPPIPSRGSWR